MPRQTGQILPFTLSELFVLLFFALALALVWQSNARADAESRAEEIEQVLGDVEERLGPDGVREVARLIQQARDSIPDDFTELVRQVQAQAVAGDALRQRLVERGMDPAAADSAPLTALTDSLLAREGEAEQRARSLEETLARTQHGEALAMCTDSLSAERVARTETESQLRNARGQAQSCFRRLGNGLDHPPCWADEAGRPEYVFAVTLGTSSVSVRPAWPGHRAGQAARDPRLQAAIGRDMTYQQFRQRAAPILEWSRRQDPECRHFIRVYDEVDGGKDAFKRNLLTVEHYFYKLLMN